VFDFLESDWFIITLEIVFVLLIAYDIKRYKESKKKEYIFNILLTLGFAIWTLYPFYKSYFGWEESQKLVLLNHCDKGSDVKLCNCVDEAIFKEYSYEEYVVVDKNSSEFLEFLNDSKEECSDSGWF